MRRVPAIATSRAGRPQGFVSRRSSQLIPSVPFRYFGRPADEFDVTSVATPHRGRLLEDGRQMSPRSVLEIEDAVDEKERADESE